MSRIVGNGGSEALFGGPCADVVIGMGGDDDLFGKRGNDEMRGGQGEDQLRGGPGDDMLMGNRHADCARLALSSSRYCSPRLPTGRA